MPTDAVSNPHVGTPETFQTRRSRWPERELGNVASAIVKSCDFTRCSTPSAGTMATVTAVYQMAPKAAEIERQVGRLKYAKELAVGPGKAGDVESVISSITFLSNLMSGPIPVPVASWDPENGSSLFFEESGFYGDLEITGNTVEYLLKWTDESGEREVYDSEEIEAGKIPPKLLVHLFGKFARTNAEVL